MNEHNAKRVFRRAIFLALGVVIVAVVTASDWRQARKQILDALHSPIAVTRWSEDGLRLADGQTIQLPGFRKLPTVSAALSEVTRRGVEIAADGRVYGLVRVHHWCGNDPVREHIARVDVADMLMYLGKGEWSTPPSARLLELASSRTGGRLSECGWEVGEFMSFKGWTQFIRAEQELGAPHSP